MSLISKIEHQCTGVNFDQNQLKVFDKISGHEHIIPFDLVLGVDGSALVVRDAMVEKGSLKYTYKPLDHGYKELTILPARDGDFQMEPYALHIWPRGQFMLIALPNMDRSFTCTLFFPMIGGTSFATVRTKSDILQLFEEYFSDTIPLLSDLVSEFQTNPTGHLGSVYCDPWHVEDKAVLLGDAAHAVVPFFGQGMNASFQDCTILNGLMDEYGDNWITILSEFSRQQVKNGHAIANMALENYIEMRDHVNDPYYKKRRELELKMEQFFPDDFLPRYSMVSFHQLPYAEVYEKGAEQFNILDKILQDHEPAVVDKALAERYMTRV